MSVAAPATNPASDLSLKLPATIGTAGQVLKNSSTAGTLEFGNKGRILQIQTGETSARVSTSSTSFQDTNLSASITLSNANNNVIVILSADCQVKSGCSCVVTVFRGGTSGTDLGTGSSGITIIQGNSTQMIAGINIFYRDTGINTTNATTYLVKYKRNEANDDVFFPANNANNKVYLHLLEEEV